MILHHHNVKHDLVFNRPNLGFQCKNNPNMYNDMNIDFENDTSIPKIHDGIKNCFDKWL